MEKSRHFFHVIDCTFFRIINRNEQQTAYHQIMGWLTHLGGARFTISFTIISFLIFYSSFKYVVIISAVSLTLSHLIVALIKKIVPRFRPYITLNNSYVTAKPLKDSSFPSGHTTAIFSLLTPYMLYDYQLTLFLLPIAIIVSISRITIGLHYPSDVIAGAIVGTSTVLFINTIFQSIF
ncbi:phosphatase PAP2 family protein [Evansella sp. AB-P1]|uniref:phosphatase PAP2 family protein n=1 Tax=Evansella sp. AB-P1 TaxID=3037653 RepID=UPI00241D648D|nr:phosphatase PAP2 family protein [Evansella sp. AB-P1]MDG5787762.1 phosphatase PAP2 family protein [Evansella sp. AB-P1]